jgi:hypothetical protein
MNFGMSGRYKQPVQCRRESAHKSRAAWAVFSLGVCMRERQHIYEDLNESSSASPGGSQQLEIPPSLNTKRAASFFQFRWFFTRREDFKARQDSIVRLFFCSVPIFCKSAWFFEKRQYFSNQPFFFKSANLSQILLISEKRQYFSSPPDFLKSAKISQIRLIFRKAQGICEFAWFLLLQIFVYIVSICFLPSYY